MLNYAKYTKKPILDIGAAYGVNTIPALKNGATVIANDLEQSHLDILVVNTPKKYRKNLKLNVGAVPCEIKIEKESLDAVLASGVLHFLEQEKFIKALNDIYDWLSPDGRFFFESSSVYNSLFYKFLPEYYKKRESEHSCPGYVENVALYVEKLENYMPESLTLFSIEDIVQVFSKTKFKIEEVEYFSFEKMNSQTDGDPESIGLVARKTP